MPPIRRSTVVVLLVAALTGCAPPSSDEARGASGNGQGAVTDPAADRAALRALLDDFLARADEGSAHERFWADDLIYTSSDGTRRGKAEIMAGYAQDEATAEAPDLEEEPGPTYSAEDVDIRLYGTTAVVAFRLVIVPPEGSDEAPSFNWNTGTFVKRDGEWRVVAWQSTRGAA